MTELEALAKDCIENHTHRLVDKPTKQDIYLREESIFIQGYRQSEKRIEELKQQTEKMCKVILDLLSFEENLDPYMYECDDAQKGELLKPFTEARVILEKYKCKKCKGEGEIRVGYNGWMTNPCPACEGRGYVFGG